jgi:dTDP-4-amino-4,6-dideoxygalactose transaminase
MKRDIKFNSFYSSSNYTKNLEKLFADYELFRQKHFSKQCIELLKPDYPNSEILLTHSATGALEIIALTIDIKEGDEVILPSYTFVSTANAFALRGAKLVFVDIELDTLGIDPALVAAAITEKTKAIVCVHYAGHACKIEALRKIADDHQLVLIEDAAMAFGSKHKGRSLGTFGDFGVVSFDITKHVSATQGGLLLVNHKSDLKKALRTYHTGTNRAAFEQGDVPYYEWVGLGSKYQMPETNAAILEVQLSNQSKILKHQLKLSKEYFDQLKSLKKIGVRLLDEEHLLHNYHEFYLVCRNETERKSLASILLENGVEAMFHYIPLHSSQFGKQYEVFMKNQHTDSISAALLRLPLHFNMSKEDVFYTSSLVQKFFKND